MGKDIALGILPFGTVNLLGRDLNIPLEVEDAVKALPTAERIQIDLAEVNGRIFHSLLGLGFFAKLAGERQRAREQIPFARALAFVVAVTRTISGSAASTSLSRPIPRERAPLIGSAHHQQSLSREPAAPRPHR